MNVPETRYAKTADRVHVAYQVRGDGPVDLVYVTGFANRFEVELEGPQTARFFDGLWSFSRLILFDERGTGLSDRRQTPELDMGENDLRAVLDAAGSGPTLEDQGEHELKGVPDRWRLDRVVS